MGLEIASSSVGESANREVGRTRENSAVVLYKDIGWTLTLIP